MDEKTDQTAGVSESAAPELAPATSDSPAQNAATEPGTTIEEVFFTPDNVPPELMATWKEMNKSWTQKTQRLGEEKRRIADYERKAQAYDSFMANPIENLRIMNQQFGSQLNQAPNNQPSKPVDDNWQPQNWNEVLSKAVDAAVTEAERRAEQKIMTRMNPVFEDLRQVRKSNIENVLDSKFEDWRLYESEMSELLDKHPTLKDHPDLLYKLAVPDNVMMSKATKKATQRIKQKSEGAQVASATAGSRQTESPKTGISIREAFNQAKRKLGSKSF